ncbi:DoxX family protein [Microbacterium sp.]|uniref:DoxX family protein n=1 Tax=Microbacterium sp. TaxID=51671 RepID=UPI003A8DD858
MIPLSEQKETIMIYVAVTVVAIAANALVAGATFIRARFISANLGDLDLPEAGIPVFAALQALGAVGLTAGLLGFAAVGIAAAVGLVLFFGVALGAHLKARAYRSAASPALFLALSVAALACAVIR